MVGMTTHDVQHDLLGLVPDRIDGPEDYDGVVKRGPDVEVIVTTLGVVYLRGGRQGTITGYRHDGQRTSGAWSGRPAPWQRYVPAVGREWCWTDPDGNDHDLGKVVSVGGWVT